MWHSRMHTPCSVPYAHCAHLHSPPQHSPLHSHMYRLIHCVSLHSDMSEDRLQMVREKVRV